MAKTEGFNQITNFFGRLTGVQRVIIGLVTVGVVGGLILLISSGINKTKLEPLFTSLETADAAKIVSKLKEKNIEYQLADNGTTVLVDSKKVYETRLSLASEGLPESGTVVGYELFDKTNLGMSEFVQKINFRRALEGELSRTISSIDGVKKARVHLVMPEKALFDKDQKIPTASVTLLLKPGKNINRIDIEGIQNLVANSVEGLNQNNVNISDFHGKVLSIIQPDKNSIAGLTATQHEQQIKVDNYLTTKVQTMLDGVLGAGNSEVRVNSDLDFTQIETTKTDFNPDKQVVRSEQQMAENSQSTDSLSYPAVNMKKEQQNTISNYEIPKTVEKIVQEVGAIKRLTVAALINYNSKPKADDKGNIKYDYTPKTTEEINNLTQIIKNAIGFNTIRNDQVSVINVQFDNKNLEQEIIEQKEIKWYQNPDLIKLIILIAVIITMLILMTTLLQSKVLKERMKIAFQLQSPGDLSRIEEERREEPLEELILDEDELLLMPAELPEQMLLEERIEAMPEEDEEEESEYNALPGKSRGIIQTQSLSEDTLLKMELKEKISDYLGTQTVDAVRLVRMMLSQEGDEKSSF